MAKALTTQLRDNWIKSFLEKESELEVKGHEIRFAKKDIYEYRTDYEYDWLVNITISKKEFYYNMYYLYHKKDYVIIDEKDDFRKNKIYRFYMDDLVVVDFIINLKGDR